MVLSLPDLKVLGINAAGFESEVPLSTHPATSQGALDLLQLRGYASGLGETLAKSRFTSRRLSLDVRNP